MLGSSRLQYITEPSVLEDVEGETGTHLPFRKEKWEGAWIIQHHNRLESPPPTILEEVKSLQPNVLTHIALQHLRLLLHYLV